VGGRGCGKGLRGKGTLCTCFYHSSERGDKNEVIFRAFREKACQREFHFVNTTHARANTRTRTYVMYDIFYPLEKYAVFIFFCAHPVLSAVYGGRGYGHMSGGEENPNKYDPCFYAAANKYRTTGMRGLCRGRSQIPFILRRVPRRIILRVIPRRISRPRAPSTT